MLVTGCWLLVTGYWLLVTGFWLLVDGGTNLHRPKRINRRSRAVALCSYASMS